MEPKISVEPFRTVRQTLKVAEFYDILVFDGPPHSMAGTLEIARASVLVILPTGLSLDDLRPSIMLAHEMVENSIQAKKIVFALCRVGDRENEIEGARRYIQKARYDILKGSLPEKTGYRRASDDGRAASETTYPTLKERAEEIAQSIIDRISKSEKQEVA
jgi:chromosome partitioning protein